MEPQKKIAIICNYTLNPARIGGMDRFFTAYDAACKSNGYTVHWFFSGGEKFEFYKNLEIEAFSETSVENGFLKFQEKNKLAFDVVVTHFVELCTPFFKKVKSYDNPYIIAVDHNPRPLHGFPIKKRLKNKLKGILYASAIDRFIGVSEYTKRQILNDYGNGLKPKITVVYNGIDTDVYLKRTEPNFGKFIVASHLRKSKGIQDLIAAVSLLNEDLKKGLEINIFGEGPMEAELKELVRVNQLEKNIKFCGSSPDLHKMFKEHSYLLQPTYMECFSLSILESLASNVPVITTSVGGNEEVVKNGENGLIYEPGKVKELVKILTAILQEKVHLNNQLNIEIEENYSLKKMLANHLNLLECT